MYFKVGLYFFDQKSQVFTTTFVLKLVEPKLPKLLIFSVLQEGVMSGPGVVLPQRSLQYTYSACKRGDTDDRSFPSFHRLSICIPLVLFCVCFVFVVPRLYQASRLLVFLHKYPLILHHSCSMFCGLSGSSIQSPIVHPRGSEFC